MIKLFGSQAEQYLAYSTWVEGGNKVIANAGDLQLYGQ